MDTCVSGYFIYGGSITIGGKIIGNSDTRGSVTVLSGNTSATHTFSSAYDSAPYVILTPVGDPGVRYWVSNVTTTGFTVNMQSAPGSDQDFYYMVQQ